MPRILVIADDLSGAAEIAGIGHRFGLSTRLLRAPAEGQDVTSDLTVLDTDTRSHGSDGAFRAVERFVEPFARHQFDLLYKKTDSVLRGNIAVELAAVAGAFDLPLSLLVAQNP